jgi:hypothetical protein
MESGVTTVADTGTVALRCTLHELGGSGIAYLEVFDHIRIRPRCNSLVSIASKHSPLAGNRIRLGVSPHALIR